MPSQPLWTLAHQGGWDELLMFGLPIVLAVMAVRWAERRAKRRSRAAAEADVPVAGQHDNEGH